MMLKLRKETNRIIFHHSLSDAGDVKEIREWHKKKGFSDIGYHYVITRSGIILDGRELGTVGAHALHRNADSIGVCMIGNFNNYKPANIQLTACVTLYRMLNKMYGKKLIVEFHHELCPGVMLNRDEFKKRLLEE